MFGTVIYRPQTEEFDVEHAKAQAVEKAIESELTAGTNG